MTSRFLGADERRNRIGPRHALTADARTDSIASIADHLVALHSSDPATVYLSAGVRMRHPSAEAIDRALYETRSVLRLHGFRSTMWVMTPSLAGAMFSSATAKLASMQTKRLVSLVEANEIAANPEAWVASAKSQLLRELSARGAATTRELGDACPEVSVPLAVQGTTVSAHSRVMTSLGFDGAVARTRPLGTWISSQYIWAPMDEWIEDGLDVTDPETGARTIVDAYLRAFGPATFTDIKWWTGWTARLVRRALDDSGAMAVDIDEGEAFVARDDLTDVHADPWVGFLPGLDPTTMGWKLRDWYLDPGHVGWLFDRNGNAGPSVWMDGRIVGGWAQAPDGEIRYRLFDSEAASRTDEFDESANRLAAFYGDTRARPRFPTPALGDLL